MRKYINGNIIANEIRMIRRRNLNCCYLIVEGFSDYKLFKRFINDNICEVKFVDGKENVIQAIDSLNKTKTPGILGIVDSDFDRIIKGNLNRDNLLETDTHDIETMIIESKTLDDFLIEYVNLKKLEEFIKQKDVDFKNVILNAGIKIGNLRFLSVKEKLELKFNEIDYSKFINYQDFNFNENELIKEVVNNTENCKLSCDEIKTKLDFWKKQSVDSWQICCGHDLTKLISIVFSNILKSFKDNELNSNEVERVLRLSYQYKYFMDTLLYESIKEWESKNTPYLFFDQYIKTEALTS